MDEISEIRGKTICTAIRTFAPNILIVDKLPSGARGELVESLEFIRSMGNIRCILGLRDVLDDPETVRREWNRDHSQHIIRTYYDAVWVYGDPDVYDIIREYALPADVADKISYTGYLDRSTYCDHPESLNSPSVHDVGLPDKKIALCLVGGGQDGFEVAWTFANTQLPTGYTGLILTGPFMPRAMRKKLMAQADENARLKVLEFINEPGMFIQKADCVITMGGYNSVCELISSGKRTLVIPRVKPRTEQLIRAEHMNRRGLLDYLHPHDLTTEALSHWLMSESVQRHIKAHIDFNGTQRIPVLIREMLGRTSLVTSGKKQRKVNEYAAL